MSLSKHNHSKNPSQEHINERQDQACSFHGDMPDERTLYDLADFFKMFADSTRVKILWALNQGELCVGDLCDRLVMTPSAISHQLKTLRQASLVRMRRQGQFIFYALADDHVKDILEKGMEHINE